MSQARKKERKLLVLYLFLFFSMALVIGIWLLWPGRQKKGMTKERLSEEIEKNLHPGDRREKVEVFLRQENIDFTYVAANNCINGILRNVHDDGIVKTDLLVKVFFDSNGYSSYEIQPIATGP
jgi:hypothetical protein